MMCAADKQVMEFPVKRRYAPGNVEDYTGCKLPQPLHAELEAVQKDAFARFKRQGLPTAQLERFKYSNIASSVKDFDGVLEPARIEIESPEIIPLALRNLTDEGWILEQLSQNSPAEDKYEDSALWDLNTAYLDQGFVFDIPAGEVLKKPITLSQIAEDDSFSSQRYIIRLGRGAQATLIEEQTGEGDYWKNTVFQIILEDGARLDHYRLENESADGVQSMNVAISLGKDSSYEAFTLSCGAGFVRYQPHAVLKGPGGSASFNGVNLLKENSHSDTTILVEHQAPHCTSNQFMRSILDDKARGVFQGKVHVHQIAQKTDGYQLSNALLLSGTAQMDTKPELEIYADDVKCSHGATTGQLEEEPLFYLRSRGLSEAQARYLLVRAFVDEVVDTIKDEAFKERIEEKVDTWLQTVLS